MFVGGVVGAIAGEEAVKELFFGDGVPYGGYNGGGMMGPGYNGYGQTLPTDVLEQVLAEFGMAGMGSGLPIGYEFNALDVIAHVTDPNGYGTREGARVSEAAIEAGRNGAWRDENEGRGPSAGAPGRPGHIDRSHSADDLAGTGYIGPSGGRPVAARGVYDLEGPEAAYADLTGAAAREALNNGANPDAILRDVAYGGRPDRDRDGGGRDRDGGRDNIGGHAPGDQHPGNDGRGGGGKNLGPKPDKPRPEKDKPRTDGQKRTEDDPNFTGPRPVILDLDGDGDGIEITELSKSTIYMDAGGDGLLHRTAWAGSGDGVLFYDPDGRSDITEKRQHGSPNGTTLRRRRSSGLMVAPKPSWEASLPACEA